MKLVFQISIFIDKKLTQITNFMANEQFQRRAVLTENLADMIFKESIQKGKFKRLQGDKKQKIEHIKKQRKEIVDNFKKINTIIEPFVGYIRRMAAILLKSKLFHFFSNQ